MRIDHRDGGTISSSAHPLSRQVNRSACRFLGLVVLLLANQDIALKCGGCTGSDLAVPILNEWTWLKEGHCWRCLPTMTMNCHRWVIDSTQHRTIFLSVTRIQVESLLLSSSGYLRVQLQNTFRLNNCLESEASSRRRNRRVEMWKGFHSTCVPQNDNVQSQNRPHDQQGPGHTRRLHQETNYRNGYDPILPIHPRSGSNHHRHRSSCWTIESLGLLYGASCSMKIQHRRLVPILVLLFRLDRYRLGTD
mmetsp:Transcript_29642/g.71708  ORF Transcript_29642/g.71708 Transcript_29642/m.71708 type:complete len:249 (-) Transcript_29642:1172-1918(-)